MPTNMNNQDKEDDERFNLQAVSQEQEEEETHPPGRELNYTLRDDHGGKDPNANAFVLPQGTPPATIPFTPPQQQQGGAIISGLAARQGETL